MKRLALYSGSGISLPRSLGYIAENVKSHSAFFILRTLAATVARGEPLSRGFAKFPHQFDRFTIGFIEAGEASGSLTLTLEHIATLLEKRRMLSQKVLGALVYPAIILVGTICITGFLTFYIFPKILPVLESFQTVLPLPTRLLIGANTFLARDWLWFIVGLALCSIGIFILFRNSFVRRAIEHFFVRIPLFGSLYRNYSVSLFLRVLALLLAGGIRIIPALVLVRAALPGLSYPEALFSTEKQISEGHRFSFALTQHPQLFPPVVIQMIAAGETTGTLCENLDSLATLYENDLEELIKNLTVFIEPILMILMGLIVGFVALAIITPIYSVTQNLNAHP
ncbi:type II secretion system F family protein [Patescibacteria group bacterium]|nr:type II secretion system F family protein [Patescibacteria group bacterium]